MRPSLITQHINFQSRKIWQKKKDEKKAWKEMKKQSEELGSGYGLIDVDHLGTSDSSDSSFKSLDLDEDLDRAK